MSFGRNSHVAKAEAAELKAQEAQDSGSRERAVRQEADDKRRARYQQRADDASAEADRPVRPAQEGAVVLRFEAQPKRPA